ncbi:hypothetical protein [Sphingomonas sp. M1-B02]|uniref:hypothetical protein n=1 Tax=Sphingomonas sp. M1-B02 TaxID=3114300 RepID=UPI002240CCD0|nr:hypothetical protein [Sphingomonas sp. S6-11]UZK67586.1 hypothetical protein OKW87_07090 [Sphingomonas sp. S6-11]
MLNPLLASSSLLLLLASPAPAPQRPDWEGAVKLMQQRVTVHVPRVTVTSTTIIMRAPRPRALVEKKADDCVKMENLAGFTVNRFDSVDLVLKDGTLLRAKLGAECPALGFYNGFYVRATKDKKICAKRDAIRSRSGRSCGVQAFTSLSAAR